MGESNLRGLLEKKTVLFHAGDWIEVGEPDATVFQEPAVETTEVAHTENGKSCSAIIWICST